MDLLKEANPELHKALVGMVKSMKECEERGESLFGEDFKVVLAVSATDKNVSNMLITHNAGPLDVLALQFCFLMRLRGLFAEVDAASGKSDSLKTFESAVRLFLGSSPDESREVV